jgi:hypothetical protein
MKTIKKSKNSLPSLPTTVPRKLRVFALVLERKFNGVRCVKYKCRCVFHYLLTHSRSRYLREPAPPLHVERSSSGHFPPPRTPE